MVHCHRSKKTTVQERERHAEQCRGFLSEVHGISLLLLGIAEASAHSFGSVMALTVAMS